MDTSPTAPDSEFSRNLPSLGTDLWLTILAKTDVEHVLSFAKVNKATSELVGDDSLWRGIWFARYHSEFYRNNDFVEDGLDDRGFLLSNMFEVTVPSLKTKDPSVSPWRSWKDKVLWRANLLRCGSDSQKAGCKRLFSRSSTAPKSSMLCPSCVQASSLVAFLQGAQLTDGVDEGDVSQMTAPGRGGEL